MEKNDITDFLWKIEELAHAGLKYTKDIYAQDYFLELEKKAKELLNTEGIYFSSPNVFKRNVYPTPNISTRAIILSKDRKEVLMVKERADSLWSFPGGWCELSLSPSQSCLKECREEAGIKGKIKKFLGVLDRYHNIETTSVPEYILGFEVEIEEERDELCFEILEKRYFPITSLPVFSHKNNEEACRRFLQAAIEEKTIFD